MGGGARQRAAHAHPAAPLRRPGRPGASVCHPEGVTEKQIRKLLSSAKPSPFIDRTPGTVAVLRSRVEGAGADPDAVARWVEAKGGRVDRTQPFFVSGHGPRCGQKVKDAEEFYVVPVDALAG